MTFLLLLAACTSTPAEKAAPHAAPGGRPNVVLFTLDTTRADALSIYGNRVAQTPTWAALAEEGTRFSRAFTVTPLTIPAHSSIFTGLYPPHHGVRDNGDFFLSDAAVTLPERLHAAGYATMASVGAEVTSHHWGFSQGFDAYYDNFVQDASAEARNRWGVERRGDAVVDDALAWLQKHPGKEQPFFAWIHLFDAHHPYRAPEPYASQYPDQPYLAEVAYADSQVGRVVGWLKAQGILDNTLIVATADHGEGLGSHGEAMHGVLLYNATTRIPVVIRPPGGQEKPGFVHFPVSLVDLAPTILSYAGVPVPDGLDGMSLQPWISPTPGADPDQREVLVEALYGYRHYGWAPQRALVSRTFKLMDSTTPELYAREDLMETTDLATTETAQLGEMRTRVQSRYATMAQLGLAGDAEQSAERMAQLEALGYVTAGEVPTEEGWDKGLPDPVRHLPALRDREAVRAAMQAGDFVGAEKAARDLIAREPGLDDVKSMLASALVKQGRAPEALEIYRAQDARGPSGNVKAALGGLLLQTGQTEEGLATLRAALDIDPYLAAAWVPYLYGLMNQGDLDALQRAVAEARQRLPDLDVARTLDGLLLAMRGQFREAEPLLQEALHKNPGQPQVSFGMGLVAASAGKPLDAEEFFREEIRLFPPALPARRELVKILANQKRYDEQASELAVLVRAQPADPLTRHALAQALYNLKRYPEADAEVDACLQLNPQAPLCLMLKANTLGKLGRKAEADQVYQEALDVAGQDQP